MIILSIVLFGLSAQVNCFVPPTVFTALPKQATHVGNVDGPLPSPFIQSVTVTPTHFTPSTYGYTSTQLFGIPKMFRWLTDQYPNINRRLSEGLTNDLQVENFYLDMNGIIHPCTHGNAEGQIIVLDETAMFKKIFLYVDRYVMESASRCFLDTLL